MFIGLWNYADDEGRGVVEPRLLKAALFPLDDHVTLDEIDNGIVVLAEYKLIHLWADDERMYYAVVGWKEHQSISKPRPSKLPEPSGNPPGVLLAGREGKGREQGKEYGPAAPVDRDPVAEALLASDSRTQYLLGRMQERDPRWRAVKPGWLMKLARDHDVPTVIEAVSYVYEQADTAEEPFPYLAAICKRISERVTA
jgi:hypothetical protein